MKNIFFYISTVVLLGSSLVRCSSANLPFLTGKYIFWLGVLCLLAVIIVIKDNRKIVLINRHDAFLILLAVYGTLQLMLFSKSTIYNSDIWNYIGYFILYFIIRNQCSKAEITKKTLSILLYFSTSTALINLILMFLQWKHWIAAPNEFFLTTGMFFSPNQLGIFLAIGCLSTLFLYREAGVLWLKIGLGLCGFLIFTGLFISESRGAFISLLVAIGCFYSPPLPSPEGREPNKINSKGQSKLFSKWKIYLGIGVLLAGSIYFISIINKNKTDSTSGRLFTTVQVTKQIIEKPFGYGLNSFSIEYNKAKAEYFENNSNWDEMKNAGYIYKANNDLLELTFELGVPWMLLFVLFIALLFWKKNDSIEAQITKTILVCLLLFSLTTSIIAMPILIIIACICSVTIINTSSPKLIYKFKNRRVYKFLAVGLILSFVFVLISSLHAENRLFKLFEDKIYLKDENQLKDYISKIDEMGEEFFMGGLILIRKGYLKEGFAYLEKGFKRSGRPSLGKTLANGLQQQKKYAEAEKIYQYNKNVEPYRYEARMDLLNLFIKTKQDAKAKAIAQEIIQLQVKIPSPTIEGYKSKARDYLNKFAD